MNLRATTSKRESPVASAALDVKTNELVSRGGLRWVLIAVLAAASLFYFSLLDSRRFGAYHDDGIYVATAKSMAEGAGYRIISLPYEPAQTKYPPLFAFLLSLIWRLYPGFPRNLPWMILLSVITTLGFLSMVWRYLLGARYATSWQALIVVGLTALNWRTMILATSVYSEMLFALLTVGALFLAEKNEKSRHTSIGLALGALIGLAFLTRTSGIALLIAVVAYYALKKDWRRTLWPLGIGALFVVGWGVWCYANKTTAQGVNVAYYTSYFAHLNQVATDLQAQSGSSRLVIFVSMAFENLVGGILISVPLVCSALNYNSLAGFGGFIIAASLGILLLILLLVAAGFARTFSRGIRLVHIYVLSSLGLYLFWLPDISYDRFLMPLLPFLLVFLVSELTVLVSLMRKAKTATRWREKTSGALIGLALSAIAGLITYGYCSGIYSSLASLQSSAARAAEDSEAIAWIKENSDSSEPLVCYRDPKYFLYTGHKAVRSFPMTEGYSWQEDDASMEKLAQAVFGIIEDANARYLVVTSTDFEIEDRPEQHRQIFDKLIEQHPRKFILVFQSRNGGSRIYRIEKSSA